MQNSPFLFKLEIPFQANLVQKAQNCHFKQKYGTKTDLNMQNSMVVLTFFVFDWKYSFRTNLLKTSKFSVSVEVWYLE